MCSTSASCSPRAPRTPSATTRRSSRPTSVARRPRHWPRPTSPPTSKLSRRPLHESAKPTPSLGGGRGGGRMRALLEVDELRAGYGSVPVLQGVSFSVAEGETAVMFGLNGAGKSTTVNTVVGLLKSWGGEVRFDGKVISGLPATEIVKRGVALCPEGRRVFPALSVRTNLELGAWTNRAVTKQQLSRVFGYFPRLEERAAQLAGTLSGGKQQMLAIGRALMSKPRLLLIDEASLGLSPKLTETVFQVVDQINDDGTTVVIVEQNVGVLPYADQALVMQKGTITFDGRGEELARSGDLRTELLG